jgi:hypothetical protein
MPFSEFDRRLLADGLGYFSRPRLASLLEMLGSSKRERVDAVTTMLRHSSAEEFEEAVEIFEGAVARVSREQARTSRRYSASAERREQRRRG